MRAANFGHLHLIQYLVAQGVEINAQSKSGATALFFAAEAGVPQIMAVLLQHGADPHITDRRLRTPLMQASAGGQRQCVKVLLEHHVDLNAQDRRRKTALDVAIEEGRVAIADLLVEHGARSAQKGEDARETTRRREAGFSLITAAQWGRLDQVQRLLDQGADPNFLSPENTTPLLQAVSFVQRPVVELLLERGASPDPPRARQDSPLGKAATLGSTASSDKVALLRLLLAAGANPNVQDTFGWTPLHRVLLNPFLVSQRHLEVVNLLLDARADPNIVDNGGKTPLDMVQTAFVGQEVPATQNLPPDIKTELRKYFESMAEQTASLAEGPPPNAKLLEFFSKRFNMDRSDEEMITATLNRLKDAFPLDIHVALQARLKAIAELLRTHGARELVAEPHSHQEQLDVLFGQVQVPALILSLYEIQDTLQAEGLSLSLLDFQLLDRPHDSGIRPAACLPFAFTGFNGTHFAIWQTAEAGRDLSQAPIVMYGDELDPPARVLAEDLHHFLRLLVTIRSADALEDLENAAQTVKSVEKELKSDSQQWEKVQAVCRHLRKRFHLTKLSQPGEYVAHCRADHPEIELWNPDEEQDYCGSQVAVTQQPR